MGFGSQVDHLSLLTGVQTQDGHGLTLSGTAQADPPMKLSKFAVIMCATSMPADNIRV